MKKRTKEENAAYSRKLRAEKKAKSRALAHNPTITEMPFPHGADTLPFGLNSLDEFIAVVKVTGEDCAECTRLNAELARVIAELEQYKQINEDIKKEVTRLNDELSALRTAHRTADELYQHLGNRAATVKVNSFGRNPVIGSIR